MSSPELNFVMADPNGAVDRIEELEEENERLREALKFARKRLEYYGTISHRRHFDHDLAEVYPKIDAALNQQQERC